eukprot:169354-Amphidinium_carterae.2
MSYAQCLNLIYGHTWGLRVCQFNEVDVIGLPIIGGIMEGGDGHANFSRLWAEKWPAMQMSCMTVPAELVTREEPAVTATTAWRAQKEADCWSESTADDDVETDA